MQHELAQVLNRAAIEVHGDDDGMFAATVFGLLDAGVSPCEVVIQTRASPERIESLFESWARLKGFILLSADAIKIVAEACRARPPANADETIAALRGLAFAEHRTCTACKSAPAQYCITCPLEALKDARRARSERAEPSKRPRSRRRR
ncbi:MAG: hypothetical protein ACOY0T_20240 [Myxococcota bacterium]